MRHASACSDSPPPKKCNHAGSKTSVLLGLARKEHGVWDLLPHEEEAIFHRKMSGFRMREGLREQLQLRSNPEA